MYLYRYIIKLFLFLRDIEDKRRTTINDRLRQFRKVSQAILSYYDVSKISLPPLTRSRNINSTSLLSYRIHVHSMVANIFLRFSSVICKVRPIYLTCFSPAFSLVKRRIRFRFHRYTSSKEDISVGYIFGTITSILALFFLLLSRIENTIPKLDVTNP